jgi:chaperonin GroEL (HSP60 family)
LTEEVFQKSIRDIFNLLANIVGKTVGPYGAATMIESMGDYHLTKDGFTVLKNIHFSNRQDNTILNLILTISHQMVMKVGDGSTTAILAAHEFLQLLEEDKILKGIRPKDVQEYIKKYVDMLCDKIQAMSNQITEENYVNIMEKIARVATNDNEEYTGFIRDIYKISGRETTISKRMSLTDKAKYDIMDDMFYIAGSYIDKIYCNAESGSKCNIVHPNILLFNFTLGNEHWDIIKLALAYMMRTKPGERMIVIAPNYDQYFMDRLRSDSQDFITAYNQTSSGGGAIPFPMVFAKNPYFRPVERVIFEDLAPFLGNRILNPFNGEEIVKKINEYYKIVSTYNQAVEAQKRADAAYVEQVKLATSQGKGPQGIEHVIVDIPKDNGENARRELEDMVGKFFGTCEAVSIGNENIEFHGFCNINQSLVDTHILDAQDQFQKELNEIENQRYITKNYIDAKERLGRIACKSAMIHVGGHTDLEKKMNDDALDDAIRACQSALNYGYTLGNNLSIFKAIKDVEPELEGQAFSAADEKIFKSIGCTLYRSFLRVINTIHCNKNPEMTIEESSKIIDESIKESKCYDLNTESYSGDIINSCRTDIEVLKGAISIVGTILSANQYLSTEIQNKE